MSNDNDNNGNDDAQGEGNSTEDAEQRDKQLKITIDKYLNHSLYGDIINYSIGALSILSSLGFVYMTGIDWSLADPCCMIPGTLIDAADPA